MNWPNDFQPRKSLGQNFLLDENVLRKIVRAIDPKPEDHFVEIGPGMGALTKHLLEAGSHCLAVEIDQRLIPLLQERFAAYPNFKLLNQDFREVALNGFAGEHKLRLVGNIPYHITSHLVFTAFAQRALLRDMLLTVQREVAERIVATPGGKEYGILSIMSQTFAHAELLFTISPHVFRPKPEVESAVVRWQFQAPPLPIVDDDFYVAMVKAIFGQRRKTLRRSLSNFLNTETPLAFIDLQRRPETLAIAELIQLANGLAKTKDA
ncbi:MAG: 16S rRNA (adenine(1518)-N(6)/adenine(1519)-N(6))-dimethyltransferase RsmA [candidate division KSB1 bacterium]